jgi:hypothetical protein
VADREQVEIATMDYVDWFNHRRLHEHCGDIPPAQLEAATTVATPASPRPDKPQQPIRATGAGAEPAGALAGN